jgi:hypothetical protein
MHISQQRSKPRTVLTTTKHNTHATLFLIRKPHSIKPLAPEPSHNLYRQYFKNSPIHHPYRSLSRYFNSLIQICLPAPKISFN